MRTAGAVGWHRKAVVVGAAVLALVAASCSSGSSGAGDVTTSTSTPAGRSEPTAVPLPEGFPATVVLALGDPSKGEQRLVAVDTVSRKQTALADQAGLAAAFSGDGPEHASMESLGLLPDGQVGVTFGFTNWDLFQVPLDASSAARLRTQLGDGLPYLPSPDGRWLPVAGAQLHLVAITGGVTSLSMPAGVDAGGPSDVVWRPDGLLLAAVGQNESITPPAPIGYTVDPGTGALSDAAVAPVAVGGPAGHRSGMPWYDASGQLHVMPEVSTLDGVGSVVLTSLGADTTHRWVIGVAAQYAHDPVVPSTGASRGWLVWWDASQATPVPHLLDIGVTLPDPLPEPTPVLAAF